MTCPWCSYKNQPSARFCGQCGQGLLFEVVCASCSTTNPAAHRFCDSCGEPTDAVVRAPVSAPGRSGPRLKGVALTDVLAPARTRLQETGLYNWETAALAAITLFALVLRLVSLTNIPPNLSADEADNLQVILQIMADNGPGFFGIDWTQAPAFNLYMDSWFMKVLGESLVGLRMASVVLTVVSLPVFYFVARQYDLDKTAALGATLLLATGLWYLHFSRNGWYNVNVALYAILAVLAATAAIRRGSLRLFAVAGLVAALGLYGHPSGRAVVVALIAYLPFALILHRENRKRLLIGYAIMLSTAALLFLPHLNEVSDDWDGYNTRVAATYIFNEQNRAQFGDKSSVQIIADQTWNNIKGFILLDPGASYVGINSRYIPGGHGFLDRFTAVLLWLGMVVSVLRWRHTLLWWVFFIVMLFPTQVLSNATPDGARAIGTAPLFYLFVALGLHWLFGLRFGERLWFRGAATVVVLAIVVLNISSYFDWMSQPEAAYARQPAVEVGDFEVWRDMQKAEAEMGLPGFNVGQWLEMKEQGKVP